MAWAADGSHLFAFAGKSWDSSTALRFIDLRGNLQVLAEAPAGGALLIHLVDSPDGIYLAYTERIFDGNMVML